MFTRDMLSIRRSGYAQLAICHTCLSNTEQLLRLGKLYTHPSTLNISIIRDYIHTNSLNKNNTDCVVMSCFGHPCNQVIKYNLCNCLQYIDRKLYVYTLLK